MRVGGKEIKGPAEEVLVLPRLDGDLVFRARAVRDYAMFQKMVHEPVAPSILVRGGHQKNYKDANYLQLLDRHSQLRLAFLVIKSLQEVEWDTVDIADPNTWMNWEKDLIEGGLSDIEVQRVMGCVMTSNSLNEAKLVEAREAFLRGQGTTQVEFSGPATGPESTQSGVPVSDSE